MGIIVKGNEAGGLVGHESTFVLFQKVISEIQSIPVFAQGGIGLHTAAALKTLGAEGVVLDSQLALFPESTVPQDLKDLCEKLNGSETKVVADHRVLVRPNSIEFKVNDQLNQRRFITKMCCLHGVTTGVLVLCLLCTGQHCLSSNYKLDGLAMAILDGLLSGILSVMFTYLPIKKLERYLYKPMRIISG